jgi:hypothetical protein
MSSDEEEEGEEGEEGEKVLNTFLESLIISYLLQCT